MALTQQQIADLAGVSRGTVDRVLNNRGHVDPEIEGKIREIAKKNHYRRNKVGAQLVRLKNPVKIGFLIQSVETQFMEMTPFMRMMVDEVENYRGMAEAQGAELVVRTNKGRKIEDYIKSLDELVGEGIRGLAVTPLEDDRVLQKLNEISETMPIVLVNRDMPLSRKLCYVGQDGYQSGRTNAFLMNLVLKGKGLVLPVTSDINNHAVNSRLQGFEDVIGSLYHGIHVLPVENCEDDPLAAYKIVKQKLQENPKINGVYFAGNGQTGGCDAVRNLGVQGKVHIVCHDFLEDNIRCIKEGLIDFTIDQDVKSQATVPVDVLIDNILTGKKPENKNLFTKIEIRCFYNIDY